MTIITKADFVVSLDVFHFALLSINVLNTFSKRKTLHLGKHMKQEKLQLIPAKKVEIISKAFGAKLKNLLCKKFAEENCKQQYQSRLCRIHGTFLDLPEDTTFSPVIDNFLTHSQRRFKTIQLAESFNDFRQLDLEGASDFIDNYKTSLKIDSELLRMF